MRSDAEDAEYPRNLLGEEDVDPLPHVGDRLEEVLRLLALFDQMWSELREGERGRNDALRGLLGEDHDRFDLPDAHVGCYLRGLAFLLLDVPDTDHAGRSLTSLIVDGLDELLAVGAVPLRGERFGLRSRIAHDAAVGARFTCRRRYHDEHGCRSEQG